VAEKRNTYDRESVRGRVRIVEETGKPITQVARDLGVNEGTLGNWVNYRVPRTLTCALLGVSLAWSYNWSGCGWMRVLRPRSPLREGCTDHRGL
jgi:hypothetical protein